MSAAAPRFRALPDRFLDQARATPDVPAVACGAEHLSYAALAARSGRLARRLRALGVGPDVPVAVLVEPSTEMLAAILGVLLAGGAYLPVDAATPPRRLEAILADARPPVVLTRERLAGRLPAGCGEVLCLDAEETVPDGGPGPGAGPAGAVAPEQLAYVMYTSGSTGRPKGVMVTHRGLANYLDWAVEEYAVARGRGVPVHSSIGFDLTITGLFTPLLVGRTVVLLREHLPGEDLLTVLRGSTNFSLVKVTPLHLELLAGRMPPGEAAGRTRTFVIGGENLLGEHVAFWRRHAPDTRLVNEYGPTETVVGCCAHPIGPGDPESGSIPIGRPIAGTRLHVLDPALEPVPAGQVGELHVSGAGVARGYLHRPDLTAERFVPDPFAPEPGGRLYRTGDLARLLAGGDLEYVGRRDHQVKVHGYRVELGDVEAAVRAHPAVREAVVVGHRVGGRDTRLVAYVVSEPAAGALPPSELRAFLLERLPEHMAPSLYVPLDALPLTPNGKVDRDALPDPRERRPDPERPARPGTPLEREVAALTREVLQVTAVAPDDNLFDIGATSFLIAQLNNRLEAAYGLDRSMTQILQVPTVAAIAEMIESMRGSGREAALAASTVRAEMDVHLDGSIEPDWGMPEGTP